MNEASEREAFEAKWPMPPNCCWTGMGYGATSFNAWDAHAHIARWEGWKARAAVPAVQPKEPVAKVRITRNQDLYGPAAGVEWVWYDLSKADALPAGDYSLYLAAPQAEARQEQPKQPDSVYSAQPKGEEATARDAARYRWLRDRLLAADFAWGDPPRPVLVFEWPRDVGVGGDCDKNIDAAMQSEGAM